MITVCCINHALQFLKERHPESTKVLDALDDEISKVMHIVECTAKLNICNELELAARKLGGPHKDAMANVFKQATLTKLGLRPEDN